MRINFSVRRVIRQHIDRFSWDTSDTSVIEIIAGVYFFSLCVSLVITLIHYGITWKYLRSQPLLILNQNLGKIGKYWCHTNGSIETLADGVITKDHKKSLRQILWMGLLGLGSAPGCFLLIIVTLSLRYLARPRLEKQLLESELSRDPQLSPEVILEFLRLRSPSSL